MTSTCIFTTVTNNGRSVLLTMRWWCCKGEMGSIHYLPIAVVVRTVPRRESAGWPGRGGRIIFYNSIFTSLSIVPAEVDGDADVMGNSFKIRHPIISWEAAAGVAAAEPWQPGDAAIKRAWQGEHFAQHAHQHLVLIYHFVEECLLNKKHGLGRVYLFVRRHRA